MIHEAEKGMSFYDAVNDLKEILRRERIKKERKNK